MNSSPSSQSALPDNSSVSVILDPGHCPSQVFQLSKNQHCTTSLERSVKVRISDFLCHIIIASLSPTIICLTLLYPSPHSIYLYINLYNADIVSHECPTYITPLQGNYSEALPAHARSVNLKLKIHLFNNFCKPLPILHPPSLYLSAVQPFDTEQLTGNHEETGAGQLGPGTISSWFLPRTR